jgi:hypothetical protein
MIKVVENSGRLETGDCTIAMYGVEKEDSCDRLDGVWNEEVLGRII